MKELIYHRLLLPAVAANADRPCATNAGTGVGTTFAEHLHNVGTTIGGSPSIAPGVISVAQTEVPGAVARSRRSPSSPASTEVR